MARGRERQDEHSRAEAAIGALICAIVGLGWASPAAAGRRGEPDPPDYGLEWCNIGDPGNRPTNPDEVPRDPSLRLGSVGYRYRMTQTELTLATWYEFVLAYAPFYEGPHNNGQFTGGGIVWTGSGYAMIGNPETPTRMGWEYAARLCNWYTNGKVNEAWAFESGAYDTSTFYVDDEGVYHHQAERSPGALFWIPSIDEWTKASHWSPKEDRYWYRQGSQDDPLISGPPQDGGQTNAGPNFGPPEAGSYPFVQSPWGLLDTSGGVKEMLETMGVNPKWRLSRGSGRGDSFYSTYDQLDFATTVFVDGSLGGLRLASIIPSPGGACVVLGAAGLIALERRRSWREQRSSWLWLPP